MLESPALLERIDLLAARTLDGAEAQGYAVGVSDGDGNRVIRTYGYRNRDAGLPVDEQTLFEIGSISKVFTGLLLASILYSLPFVVQPLTSAFVNMGNKEIEAAATLGLYRASNTAYTAIDPRAVYNHMAGRTSFMFTVPLFPAL